jgi:hypothetical protein
MYDNFINLHDLYSNYNQNYYQSIICIKEFY